MPWFRRWETYNLILYFVRAGCLNFRRYLQSLLFKAVATCSQLRVRAEGNNVSCTLELKVGPRTNVRRSARSAVAFLSQRIASLMGGLLKYSRAVYNARSQNWSTCLAEDIPSSFLHSSALYCDGRKLGKTPEMLADAVCLVKHQAVTDHFGLCSPTWYFWSLAYNEGISSVEDRWRKRSWMG